MGNPELPLGDEPDKRPKDIPEAERLGPGEIDLTGAVQQNEDLRDVINDAIIETRDETELPDWGARTVARYLANNHQPRDFSSALHRFAATDHADFDSMAAELAELWNGELPEDVSGWIDRLGTYIVARTRAGYGTVPELAYRPETRAAIEEFGPAYAAFLRLPDVTESNARDLFHESYYDSFDSLDEIAQHVADTHEVWQLLEDASLSHLASPDPKLLLALARQRWDIVAHDGRFYLFDK